MISKYKIIYVVAIITITGLAAMKVAWAEQMQDRPEGYTVVVGTATNVLVGDIYAVSGVISNQNLINISLRSVVAIYGETNKIIIPLRGSTSGRPMVQLGFELIQTNEDLPEYFIRGYLPKHKKLLSLEMVNSAGAEVSKSTEGRALDGLKSLSPHTPSSTAKHGDYFYISFRKGIPDASWHNFDFSKYFLITEPGDYKLMISQQLYFEDENFYLKSVALPKVTLNVKFVK